MTEGKPLDCKRNVIYHTAFAIQRLAFSHELLLGISSMILGCHSTGPAFDVATINPRA